MPSKLHLSDLALGRDPPHEEADRKGPRAEVDGAEAGRVGGQDADALDDGDARPPGSIFWLHQEEVSPWQHSSPQEVFVGAPTDTGAVTQRLRFDVQREDSPLQFLGADAPAAGRLLGLWLEEPKPDAEPAGGPLLVSAVEAASQLRCTADGDPGVCPGDTIVQVDDDCLSVSAVRERLGQLAEEGGRFELTVRRRPPLFEVELKVEGPQLQLGLSLGVNERDAYRIKVRQVRTKGMVPAWNAEHGSLRVCAGDWIVQVNGQARTTKKMCAAMMAAEQGATLRLLVATPQRHVFQPELPSTWASPFPAGGDDFSPRSQESLSDGFVEVSQVPDCLDADPQPIADDFRPALEKEGREVSWKGNTLAI